MLYILPPVKSKDCTVVAPIVTLPAVGKVVVAEALYSAPIKYVPLVATYGVLKGSLPHVLAVKVFQTFPLFVLLATRVIVPPDTEYKPTPL
jgi:hypothetical protein